MKKKNEDEDMIVNSPIQIKLPQLVIAKLGGTILDWLLYFNQF